ATSPPGAAVELFGVALKELKAVGHLFEILAAERGDDLAIADIHAALARTKVKGGASAGMPRGRASRSGVTKVPPPAFCTRRLPLWHLRAKRGISAAGEMAA